MSNVVKVTRPYPKGDRPKLIIPSEGEIQHYGKAKMPEPIEDPNSPQIRVAKLNWGGTFVTDDVELICEQVREFFKDETNAEIRISFVSMSKQKFDNLEEFQGY